MNCPIMVLLIEKLDTVRAEQCNARGNVDDTGKKKRLRRIEEILDNHERTCAICRQINPQGTKFVEQTRR